MIRSKLLGVLASWGILARGGLQLGEGPVGGPYLNWHIPQLALFAIFWHQTFDQIDSSECFSRIIFSLERVDQRQCRRGIVKFDAYQYFNFELFYFRKKYDVRICQDCNIRYLVRWCQH